MAADFLLIQLAVIDVLHEQKSNLMAEDSLLFVFAIGDHTEFYAWALVGP
jgi:hypothetical protein